MSIVFTFQAFVSCSWNDVGQDLVNYGKSAGHSCKTNFSMTFNKLQ